MTPNAYLAITEQTTSLRQNVIFILCNKKLENFSKLNFVFCLKDFRTPFDVIMIYKKSEMVENGLSLK